MCLLRLHCDAVAVLRVKLPGVEFVLDELLEVGVLPLIVLTHELAHNVLGLFLAFPLEDLGQLSLLCFDVRVVGVFDFIFFEVVLPQHMDVVGDEFVVAEFLQVLEPIDVRTVLVDSVPISTCVVKPCLELAELTFLFGIVLIQEFINFGEQGRRLLAELRLVHGVLEVSALASLLIALNCQLCEGVAEDVDALFDVAENSLGVLSHSGGLGGLNHLLFDVLDLVDEGVLVSGVVLAEGVEDVWLLADRVDEVEAARAYLQRLLHFRIDLALVVDDQQVRRQHRKQHDLPIVL